MGVEIEIKEFVEKAVKVLLLLAFLWDSLSRERVRNGNKLPSNASFLISLPRRKKKPRHLLNYPFLCL